jgi:hypothetical protein
MGAGRWAESRCGNGWYSPSVDRDVDLERVVSAATSRSLFASTSWNWSKALLMRARRLLDRRPKEIPTASARAIMQLEQLGNEPPDGVVAKIRGR